MGELKACPFCGNEAAEKWDELSVMLNSPCVGCNLCGVKHISKTAWNTRADGWVSVEDELPDEGNTVLIVDSNGWMATCRRPVLIHNMELVDTKTVIHQRYTHWMPLPDPPKA